MDYLLIIYQWVAVVVFIGVFLSEYAREFGDREGYTSVFIGSFFIALTWPVFIPAALVSGVIGRQVK